MYIHNYQIHNVLNVYRKHLSQETDAKKGAPTPEAPKGDSVALSAGFHRQSLIAQVSAEIVDRISQEGTPKNFEDAISKEWRRSSGPLSGRPSRREVEFTYSLIDENNRKSTNTLPVENFSPLTGQVKPNAQENAE
jgi:hypothetical protein